eukprot:NODE_2381_length_1193_cov_14.932458_g2267_i0.p2 GENE.NODE_2381_length_1193_cov_14.932458_g2267_i0~~NODE_2381_length_1193_cov_14.932458_g2267_i0.p2  ORF type:complete len:196 (+),score=56.44 NODE_2381_length_1193_cov_14.932458_g2267_i0:520-1107(+)
MWHKARVQIPGDVCHVKCETSGSVFALPLNSVRPFLQTPVVAHTPLLPKKTVPAPAARPVWQPTRPLQPTKPAIATQPTKQAIATQPTKQAIATQPTKQAIATQPTKQAIAIQPPKQPIAIQPPKQPIAIQPSQAITASQSPKPKPKATIHPPIKPAAKPVAVAAPVRKRERDLVFADEEPAPKTTAQEAVPTSA